MPAPKERGKRKPKPHGRYWIYTTATLAELYKVEVSTVQRWIRRGLLNPISFLDIVDKYNNRYKLDRRRRG